MIKAKTGLNDQQAEIINRLRDGQKMPKILKELNIKLPLCKKWIQENEEFKRKCRNAITTSKGITASTVHDPCGGLPHGGYAKAPDALSRRIYQQHLSAISSLENQKAMLDSDPLEKGLTECPELDVRIRALRSCLDDYGLNKRFAHEPAPKRYDDK